MKRLMLFAVLAMSFVFYSCGDDEPDAGITRLQSHLDERFDNIKSEIDTLKEDVELLAAGAKTPLSDGVIPPDTRKDPDVIKDETGGLPPTGVPTGEPVLDPIQGIPVFGEGQIVFCLFSETDAHGNYLRPDTNGIYVMDSNGAAKKPVVLPEVSFREPAFSVDGENIAYCAGEAAGSAHTFIRHIQSGREFRLTERDGLYPAWSWDGRQIVFEEASNLYISSVDPFNPQVFKLTHDGNFNTMPTWSPDGRQIAFASILDGNYNIFAINVDGTNRIRLTNNPADDERPDWSPDGRQIAFMSHRHGTWDIFVVNTKTFVETKLTDSQGDYREPSWSPDSEQIAIADNGEGEIYVINADGTGLTNITNSPDYETSPDWQ